MGAEPTVLAGGTENVAANWLSIKQTEVEWEAVACLQPCDADLPSRILSRNQFRFASGFMDENHIFAESVPHHWTFKHPKTTLP